MKACHLSVLHNLVHNRHTLPRPVFRAEIPRHPPDLPRNRVRSNVAGKVGYQDRNDVS
jgi:hypothetical protein